MATISEFLEDASVHKIYIGNLSWKCTTEDLVTFFAPAGVVYSSQSLKSNPFLSIKSIIGVRGTRPAGYAFVAFSTAQEAEKSLDLNKEMLLDRSVKINHALLKTAEELEQRKQDRQAMKKTREKKGKREPAVKSTERAPLNTSPSRPQRGGEPEGEPSETTLYVGNLPWAVTDEDLASMFKEYNVVSANVVRMRGNERNGGLGRSKGFGFVELSSKRDQDAVMSELQHISVNDRLLVIKVAKAGQVSRKVENAQE